MDALSVNNILVLLIHSLLQILLSNAQEDLLFFASPGGRGFASGFYGGKVDLSHGGYPKNIFKIGYHCIDVGNYDIEGLLVKSTSLDLGSGSVILHIGSLDESSKVTLLRVPLCQRLAYATCDNAVTIKPIFIDVQINTHDIASFASYGDNIYFISETIETNFATGAMHKRIELRNLTGCGGDVNPPFTSNSAFYVESCSTVMANVVAEDYDIGSTAQYHATAGLAIIPTASGPIFYTQIQHYPPNRKLLNSDTEMHAFILMRIGINGEIQLLHEEYVTTEHRKYIIQGLGQVTYRKDLLCWTALDRIVCAKIDNRGTIYQARTIMEPGAASGLCTASPDEPFFSTITTGIAIAKVPQDINRDEVALFFGCIAQTRGLGGSGFVQKRGNGHATVQILRRNLTTLYAGSMLVTDICSGGDKPPLFLLNNVATLNSSLRHLIACIIMFLITYQAALV